LFPLQVALLCLISWGGFAEGLGAPDLVWGDAWWIQFWVGLSVSLLFCNVLFIRAILDRRPGNTPPDFGVKWSLFWFATDENYPAPEADPPWPQRAALALLVCLIAGPVFWFTPREFHPYLIGLLITAVLCALRVWKWKSDLSASWNARRRPTRNATESAPDGAAPQVVRRVGAFLLWTWALALALFYLPKLASQEGRTVHSLWMLVGLLAGVGLTVALVLVFELWWRTWWSESWLFKSLPAFRYGAVPEQDRPLHALATLMTALIPGFFLALFLYESLFFDAVWSPVWLVCLLLALFNSAYGFVTFHFAGLQYVLAVLFAAIVYVSNTAYPYKMTLPGLEAYESRAPVKLDAEPPPPNPPLDLIETDALLKTFHDKWVKRRGADGSKPKLVIVASTGGGIQAAVWTSVVLEGLEQDSELCKVNFPDHIRLMTGASGGMQAAALYAADFQTPPPKRPAPQSVQLGRDSLWPTMQTMLLHDLPGLAWPGQLHRDRGRSLQRQWEANCTAWSRNGEPAQPPSNWYRRATGDYERGPSPFARKLHAMRHDERECNQPVVIFSPMMVEDCRRLLISNLALDWFTKTRANHLNPDVPYQPPNDPDLISIPATEFWRYFPDARDSLAVGTAARMSATFPFVGPAVSLPTDPPRRVVDAGYFDNFGINLAAIWIHRHRQAVLAYTSGVAIVEIRAYPRREQKLVYDDRPSAERGTPTTFDWAVSEVGSPPLALYNLYARSAYFRNDQLLDAVNTELNGQTGTQSAPPSKRFFATVTFECPMSGSLSWTLPERDEKTIRDSFVQKSPEVAALRTWFGTGGKVTSPVQLPQAAP
jgi:hypothetical protein